MKTKSFGIILLIFSLIIGGIILINPEIGVRVEKFAATEAGETVVDQNVKVPPWNASEEEKPRGWVGFNVILNHTGKISYEAKGIIIPADGDPQPKMVMRAVNLTGLQMLIFDGFGESTWNSVEIYAWAFLDGEQNRLADEFTFFNLDNSSKYIMLFRGLKNETQDRPILISLKETYYEPRKLLEPLVFNTLVLVPIATSVIGIILLIESPRSRAKLSKKHRT